MGAVVVQTPVEARVAREDDAVEDEEVDVAREARERLGADAICGAAAAAVAAEVEGGWRDLARDGRAGEAGEEGEIEAGKLERGRQGRKEEEQSDLSHLQIAQLTALKLSSFGHIKF